MTTKILAGLVAAIALTGVGIYAATGSVPGVETVAEVIAGPAPTGGCSQSSVCPLSASTCPSMAESACGTANSTAVAVEPAAACFGGLTMATGTSAPVSVPAGCCAE